MSVLLPCDTDRQPTDERKSTEPTEACLAPVAQAILTLTYSILTHRIARDLGPGFPPRLCTSRSSVRANIPGGEGAFGSRPLCSGIGRSVFWGHGSTCYDDACCGEPTCVAVPRRKTNVLSS